MNDKQDINKLKAVLISMNYRCNNKEDKYYGAKGIKVCSEWINNPDSFIKWSIENGYREGLSIDRIDGDDDYTPLNCRWVDMKTQANNRTNNSYIEVNGNKLTYAECEEQTGISQKLISSRVRKGRTVEEVLSKEIYNGVMVEFDGKRMNISEWGRYTGLGREVIKKRINSGWSIEKSLTTPLKSKQENRAKLNKELVIDIRNQYNEYSFTVKDLSIKYDVTPKTIRNIIQYKTWKEI